MLLKDPPLQATDNLWVFGTNQYPLFLVQGEEESAIFEGGVGAMGPLLREQLEETGVDRHRVKQIIITHAHPDHVMALPLFRELFPDATMAGSEVAAATLKTEKAVAFFAKIDEAITGALIDMGLVTESHRPEPLAEHYIAVDRVIGEGDKIEVGEISFCVIKSPGHSDCSLSFYQRDQGILLVSDATGFYLPEHEYWWPNYFAGYADYLATIGRLAKLATETLCLSHNAVIQGKDEVKSYFDRAIAATEAYHQRILDETNAGRTVREIAEALGAEIHEKAGILPVDFFQKNSGILVKQSLKHEGIEAKK